MNDRTVVPAAGPPRRYRAYGLRISSELPLDDFASDGASAPADLTIRFGRLPALEAAAPISQGIRYAAGGEAFGFEAPRVGRFSVRGAAEIVIDPLPDVSPRWIEAYLQGVALPVVCYRRGLVALHASAIAAGGAAIAFAGPSSAGKSTLAAHLEARGGAILADDTCVIRLGDRGPQVLAGPRRIKLWPDALSGLGRRGEAPEAPVETSEKLFVPARSQPPAAVPLRALYVLGEANQNAAIRRLEGVRAFEALMAQAYRPELPKLLDIAEAHVLRCGRMLADVRCFALPWRGGAGPVADQAARVAAHIAETLLTA